MANTEVCIYVQYTELAITEVRELKGNHVKCPKLTQAKSSFRSTLSCPSALASRWTPWKISARGHRICPLWQDDAIHKVFILVANFPVSCAWLFQTHPLDRWVPQCDFPSQQGNCPFGKKLYIELWLYSGQHGRGTARGLACI